MSPEDDHLQGEQVTSSGDGGRNQDHHWSPKNNNGVHQSIGSNNNGYISSNAILKQNGGDSHTWLPLLSHHHNHNNHLHANEQQQQQQQQPTPSTPPMTNNNKWPVLTAPSTLTNSKYTWRELPQDDDSMGLYKPKNLNASAAAALGSAGLNGKKSEHESLTGVKRHSLNDYSNDDDEFYEQSECGIGLCKPRWARKFASTHVFMVIFLLAWILQVRENVVQFSTYNKLPRKLF